MTEPTCRTIEVAGACVDTAFRLDKAAAEFHRAGALLRDNRLALAEKVLARAFAEIERAIEELPRAPPAEVELAG